jgi:hypothetical protein
MPYPMVLVRCAAGDLDLLAVTLKDKTCGPAARQQIPDGWFVRELSSRPTRLTTSLKVDLVHRAAGRTIADAGAQRGQMRRARRAEEFRTSDIVALAIVALLLASALLLS